MEKFDLLLEKLDRRIEEAERLRKEEEKIINRIKERDKGKKEYSFYLEATDYIAKGKHAFVAVLKYEEGRIIRFFANRTFKWKGKRIYDAFFSFKAKEGDVIEARLSTRSWKYNDERVYYVVEEGKLKEISYNEAMKKLKAE